MVFYESNSDLSWIYFVRKVWANKAVRVYKMDEVLISFIIDNERIKVFENYVKD